MENEKTKSIKKYAVIITYTYDPDVPVYPFETEEDAIEALEKCFHDELRISKDEDGANVIGTISPDKRYASITTNVEYAKDLPITNKKDKIEMRVGNIYEWSDKS